MDFITKLKRGWKKGKFICIGLDPVSDKLPKSVSGDFFKFNKAIIDETSDSVLAYKPNSAFYEAEGAKGIEWLKKTCDYIHQYTSIPVILDAKRADIGSTNEGYVKFAFDYLSADAYDEKECPLCREGKPINTEVGHGKEYLRNKKN